MAVYDFPEALKASVASFCLSKAGVQFRSPFNGTLQAVGFAAERWTCSLTTPGIATAESGDTEAFLNLLAGGVNFIRIYHPGRPYPVGTLKGSPIMQTAAARGATQIVLGNCTPGATLKAGDMLGVAVGTQLFQVAFDCTANLAGTMTVPLVNRVRAGISSGAAVTWQRPYALFACPAMRNDTVHRPGYLDSAAIDLVEVWDPNDDDGSSAILSGALLLGDGFLHLDETGQLILE
jgi:hypothetical protein